MAASTPFSCTTRKSSRLKPLSTPRNEPLVDEPEAVQTCSRVVDSRMCGNRVFSKQTASSISALWVQWLAAAGALPFLTRPLDSRNQEAGRDGGAAPPPLQGPLGSAETPADVASFRSECDRITVGKSRFYRTHGAPRCSIVRK